MELQTKVTLPSNGKLYKLKEVTIKPMTSEDYDIINDTTDTDYIFKVIQNSIVEPKDLQIEDLHPYDIDAILFALRNLSIGPIYAQNAICPYCNHPQSVDIDMDEFVTETLDELPPTKVTLSTGDVVELKVLTEKLQDIAREKSQGDIKKLNFYLTVERIDKIVLKEPIQASPSVTIDEYHNPIEIEEYVRSMSYKDRVLLTQALQPSRFGIDTTITVTCSNKNCGKEFRVIGGIDGVSAPEFFRPTLFKK